MTWWTAPANSIRGGRDTLLCNHAKVISQRLTPSVWLKNLKFAGRVGTGFSEKLLRSLFDDLQKIRVESCPFSNLPAPGRNRWDQGLTAAEMKRCRWVKPSMVCQVKFTEWTRDDRLRQAVFLGTREDKNPNEVVREKAKTIGLQSSHS